MSKTWGKISAWAVETEEREAATAAATDAESPSFPSLKEAVSAKPKKKKMTLFEFTMGGYSAFGGAPATDYSYNRLTSDEMLCLPTSPKERSTEEMQYGRLSGGFSSYGCHARTMCDRNDNWGGGNRRPFGGFG